MSLQLFSVKWIFPRSLSVIFHDRYIFTVGHKNYFKDWFLTNAQSAFHIFTSFDLINRLYYQKHIKQVTLNHRLLQNSAVLILEVFVRIWLDENLSMNHGPLTVLLYMKQIWMTQLILQCLSEGLSSFNPKGFSSSFGWSCSLCEEGASFCLGRISRKPREFLFMSSTGFTTFSALLLFFSLSITLCVFLYIFYAISSNIDEARSVRPSVNVFVFGDFNVHHRDWLNSFDRTVKLCYNFLNISNVIITQMTLFRRLTFLLCSLTVTLTILLYWMYLFLLTRVFVLVFFSLF